MYDYEWIECEFGGKHANFGDWLEFDLNLRITTHVKVVVCVSRASGFGDKVRTIILGIMQREWDVPFMELSFDDLNVTTDGIMQVKKGYERGWLKDKGFDGVIGNMHASENSKRSCKDLEDVTNVRGDGKPREL